LDIQIIGTDGFSRRRDTLDIEIIGTECFSRRPDTLDIQIIGTDGFSRRRDTLDIQIIGTDGFSRRPDTLDIQIIGTDGFSRRRDTVCIPECREKVLRQQESLAVRWVNPSVPIMQKPLNQWVYPLEHELKIRGKVLKNCLEIFLFFEENNKHKNHQQDKINEERQDIVRHRQEKAYQVKYS